MKERRLAREIAIQSLYHMALNDVDPQEAIDMVIAERNDDEPQTAVQTSPETDKFIARLVHGVRKHQERIDAMLENYLTGWSMERLSRVDLQVLRLAVLEMVFAPDFPAKVAVNEAIDLAKHFGTDESGKFVNGVLGQMIKDVEKLREQLAINNK